MLLTLSPILFSADTNGIAIIVQSFKHLETETNAFLSFSQHVDSVYIKAKTMSPPAQRNENF